MENLTLQIAHPSVLITVKMADALCLSDKIEYVIESGGVIGYIASSLSNPSIVFDLTLFNDALRRSVRIDVRKVIDILSS